MNAVPDPLLPDMARALRDPGQAMPAGLRGAAGPTADRRFAVHRNTFVATLVDALGDGTPVVRALVGETFFRAMARARVLADPPQSPVLSMYVDGFADFIAGFGPARAMPWLADVARLEALRIAAYHAADAPPLPATAFAPLQHAPARLAATRVRLHPALRWMASPHAVLDLWQAHQHDGRVDLADLDLDRPQAVLVMRPALDVAVVPLPAGGVAWLDALARGLSLGQAFDAAGADADLHALLALLVTQGLATDLHVPEDL